MMLKSYIKNYNERIEFMEGWYPIDLHTHTVNGVTRDRKTDNVYFTYSLFQNVIEKYKFGLMAVTNHNVIDIENYILMRYLCKKNKTNLLLGVELDSKLTMGSPIHIAAIFNSNDFLENYKSMKDINDKTDNKKHDTSNNELIYTDTDIIDLLSKYDVILIPHGDKDRGVFKDAGKKQIEEALKKISEGFIRIFDNPSKWKMEQIKTHLDNLTQEELDEFGGVLFSDNRDWSNYDERYKDFYMNAEPSFRGLVHAITNPTKRFSKRDEININTNYISKIIIRETGSTGRMKKSEIALSPYYNCIIGKSGTGKSLLLHLIKKNLLRDSTDNDKYEGFNECNIEFYNELGQLLNPEIINIGVGENLFDKIITASTTKDSNDLYKVAQLLNSTYKPKVQFDKFIMDYNGKVVDYNRYRIMNEESKEKLTQSIISYSSDITKLNLLKDVKTFEVNVIEENDFTYNKTNILEFSKYTEYIENLEELTSIYHGKYKTILNGKLNELNNILMLSKLEMEMIYSKDNLKKETITLINTIINSINGDRSEQAKTKNSIIENLPKKRNIIIEYVKDIYLNTKKMNNFDFSFNLDELNTIKGISKDSSVEVQEYFEKDQFEKFDIKDNEIFKTRGYKSKLGNGQYDLTNRVDALKVVEKYLVSGMLTSDGFVFHENFKPKVKVLFDKQDVVNLNPGDISKKYISIYFKERLIENDNSVILFDQIENDVDKPFINGTIRTLIEDTKGKVQMIVVTHDPIVAVNSDPNNYIISNKDENQMITYRSFVIESSEKDEIKTISDVVDGSKNVIKRRYEIYKGENIDE